MKDERSNRGNEKTSSAPTARVSLDDVIITDELARRPTRSPDYAAEGRALTALAEALTDSPQTILQKLAETALTLCRADSAGIRMLEPGGAAGVLRWHAVAGQFHPDMRSRVLREASPSRVVLDRDASLLFAYPERHFDYGMAIDPPIVEALLVPFHNAGNPVGTLWVVAHTPSRKFDLEDQRVLTNLSRFASMAYQLKTAALTAVRAGEDVRQILDGAAVGLSRCSRELRYLECNRAYEKLTGLSTAQIIGRPIADIIGSRAFEVIRPYVERVLRGERVEYEEEVPVSLPVSGDAPRFFHVVYEPWFDSEGRITGFIASVSDTTELKRTTKALEERERRLGFALDASDAGSWMRDTRSGRVEWDDRYRKLYGFPAGEPASFEAWLSCVHEEDRQQVLEVAQQIMHTRTQDTFNCEFRIIRPDGTLAWIESRGQVHRDDAGRAIRFTGFELDITARRRGEEALAARRDEERDRTLQLLLETAPLGILSIEATGRIITANRALETMFGWLPGELIGQSVDQLLPPTYEDRPAAHRGEYFATPRPRYMGGGLDLVGQRKDGSTFAVEVSLNHVTTADGGRAIAFVTDISERKRDQAALQRSHGELEQRTLQLRRLASQLTLTEQNVRKQLASTLHDGLQQLLFTASMRLDEIVTSSVQDGQAELLQRVRADIQEATEAARTLSVNLFPPVLHLSGLPAALTWLARRTQEQYSVSVNLTADPQANPEASDVRILLFECVRELLFNAVKHADVDSIDVNLGVAPEETIQIQVSDDGIGFDPTISLADTNQHGGLGLFSIRERLSLLGGHLHIDSAPRSGSRFTLMLPRNGWRRATDGTEAPRDAVARPERLVGNTARGTSKSLRILISDDHAVVRAGLRDLFGKHPQLKVVGEATNGIEAITQAVALQPDIIVMDVSLPEMNGIDATREIHRTLPHIRIVGLSTHHDESTERLMRNAGAEAYFTKNEGADRLLDYLLSIRGKGKGVSQISSKSRFSA